MNQEKCFKCNGTGYASAARDTGMEDAPLMLRPIGLYLCPLCRGTGERGMSEKQSKKIREQVRQCLINPKTGAITGGKL